MTASIKDIFDLQDEITMKILTELQVKLFTVGETGRIVTKGTNNLEAYLKVWESVWYRNQNNKEANAVSKRLVEEAIRLDPNYAAAHIDYPTRSQGKCGSASANRLKKLSPMPCKRPKRPLNWTIPRLRP